MMKLQSALQLSVQEDVETIVLTLVERLDFLDIQILRKKRLETPTPAAISQSRAKKKL